MNTTPNGAGRPHQLVVDELTQDRLGQAGLDLVASNLWPVDCQTCGHPLPGGSRVALAVDVYDPAAHAGLHHPTCRTAVWNDTGFVSMPPGSLATLSHAARLSVFWVDSRPERWMMMTINPGLELISLRVPHDGEPWQLDMSPYLEAGFRNDGTITTEPIPGAYAERTPTEVRIHLPGGAAGSFWSSHDDQAQDLITRHGGLFAAITHAQNPADTMTTDDLVDDMTAGRFYIGWIPLRA